MIKSLNAQLMNESEDRKGDGRCREIKNKIKRNDK